MRVPINLASRPYENLRPSYFAAATAAVLLIGLALLIVWNVQANRNRTRELTDQSEQLQKTLQTLRTEQRELQQWLERPEVSAIRERSAFLNSVIVRKGLSWTQMFMDLESILPERVQVVSIHPKLNQDQQAELTLTVSAPTVPPLVEFLKSLETAPQFGAPMVESQRFPADKGPDPNIQLDLSVSYHQTAGPSLSSLQHTARKAAEDSRPPVAEAAPAAPAAPTSPPAAAPAPAAAEAKPTPPTPSGAPIATVPRPEPAARAQGTPAPAAPGAVMTPPKPDLPPQPQGPVWNPSAPPLSEVLSRPRQTRPPRPPASSQEDQ